jgi:ParB-like chromosome segregation protein Spo0J
MEIRQIPITDIKAAEYNPRRVLTPKDSEWQKLDRSIREFGFVEPLVWNLRTGNLVGGHQRLKVLVAQGLKEVEVSIVDLDLEREKALNIALDLI